MRKKTAYRGVWAIGDGRYEVLAHWTDPKDPTVKKKIRRRLNAKSAAAANRKREALRDEAMAAGPKRKRLNLEAAVKSWLALKLPGWKASTRTQNASLLDNHVLPTLGAYWLDAIEPADVVAWRDAMLAASGSVDSVNSRLRLLKQVLGDVCHEHGIPNPAARVSAARKPLVEEADDDYVPDAGEALAIVDWFRRKRPQWHPHVCLLWWTGIRWGEATALRWSDFIADDLIHVRRAHYRGAVDHPKAKKSVRKVVVVPPLREVLDAWQAKTGRVGGAYVFLGKRGNLHTPSVMSKPFADCCAELGLPRERIPAVKWARKAHNDVLRQVAPEAIRQALMGHAGAEVGLEHYTQVRDDELRTAASNVVRLVTGGGTREQ